MASKVRRVLQSIGNAESLSAQSSLQNLQNEANNQIANINNDMNAFVNLSTTLAKEVKAHNTREKEKQVIEGKIAYAKEKAGLIEVNIPEAERADRERKEQQKQVEFNEGQKQIKTARQEGEKGSLNIQKKGASYQEGQSIVALSGTAAFTYTNLKANEIADLYKPWLKGQMANNDQLQIQRPDGTTFKPNEATTIDDKILAQEALTRQFYKDTGLVNINDTLLSTPARKGGKSPIEKIMGSQVEVEKDEILNDALKKSFENTELYQREFAQTHDLGQLISSLSTTLDPKTKEVRGHAGAIDLALNYIKDLADTGDISPEQFQEILKQEVPWAKGKTFGEHYKNRLDKLDEEVIDENKKNSERDRELKREEGKKVIDEGIAWLEQDDPDNPGKKNYETANAATFADMRKKAYAAGALKADMSRLDAYELNLSQTARSKDFWNRHFEGMETKWQLSTDYVLESSAPADVKAKWLKRAKVADANRAQHGDLKQERRSISQYVKKKSGYLPQDDLPIVGGMISRELESKFLKRVKDNIGKGIENPIQEALLWVQNHYDTNGGDGENTNGRYYNNPGTGNWDNYTNELKTAGLSNDADATGRDHAIKEEIKKKGINTVLNSKGKGEDAIFTEAEVIAWDTENNKFGTPNWKPDPRVEYYSSEYGIPYFDIVNRQRRAWSTKEKPLPDLELNNQGVDSDWTNFYQKSYGTSKQPQSPNQSARFVSHVVTYKGFNSATVPKGYGQSIEKHATAAGIEPWIVAGLLETESTWDAGARSGAGAQGLAQIMPATAEEWGVDPNDPEQSIKFAADYLAYLRDYFQGDMMLAIAAYNGGMGNIEYFYNRFGTPYIIEVQEDEDGRPLEDENGDWIPVLDNEENYVPNWENYNYVRKVMRSAYKYGDQSYLNSPHSMRSSLIQA